MRAKIKKDTAKEKIILELDSYNFPDCRKKLILLALDKLGNSLTLNQIAKKLGIPANTLYMEMKTLGEKYSEIVDNSTIVKQLQDLKKTARGKLFLQALKEGKIDKELL